MKRVVISQSMFFPWVGLLEQVRLADVFVHFDDVQFSRGSFVNRVQVKTQSGPKWLTVPLVRQRNGQSISELQCTPIDEWGPKHLALLSQAFRRAPWADDALQLAAETYRAADNTLWQLARSSFMALVKYFGLERDTTFIDAGELNISGGGSQRVLEIVRVLEGTQYITGHGAARYLQHEEFARHGISVQYMEYQCRPYPQLHGEFTPYVTALDLVANCGRAGIDYICSETVGWEEFLRGSS